MSDALNKEIKKNKINDCVVVFKCSSGDEDCLYFEKDKKIDKCKYFSQDYCTNKKARMEAIKEMN